MKSTLNRLTALSGIVIALIVLVLVLIPDNGLIDVPEEKQLDKAERQRLGASFIHLSDGYVHYRLQHQGKSPLIVFVHGYSSPSFVWDRIEPLFSAAGFSTLTYDLYGHGLSERLSAPHNRDLFTRQLDELLAKLAPDEPVHLVGWSMGAMIATGWATAHPERVRSVSFISPSGLPIHTGFLGRVAFVPVIGDIGFAMIGGQQLAKAQAEFFEDADSHRVYMNHYAQQTRYVGFKRSMLSTLREMDMDHFHEGYRLLGTSKLPTFVMWSARDRATPFSNSEVFKQLVPQATVIPIDGVGHASHFEAAERLAQPIVDFMKNTSLIKPASEAAITNQSTLTTRTSAVF